MNLTFPEVSVILGVCSIVAGVIIKIFYKPDNLLKNRLDLLEIEIKAKNIELVKDFTHKNELLLNTLKISNEKMELYNMKLTESIEIINRSKTKELESVQKNFDKVELKLEKLSDLLLKIIQQIKNE